MVAGLLHCNCNLSNGRKTLHAIHQGKVVEQLCMLSLLGYNLTKVICAGLDTGHRAVDDCLYAQVKIALDRIHSMGYSHNDVKPSNVFIDAHGTFLLGDFGSVRRLGTDADETTNKYVPRDNDFVQTREAIGVVTQGQR